MVLDGFTKKGMSIQDGSQDWLLKDGFLHSLKQSKLLPSAQQQQCQERRCNSLMYVSKLPEQDLFTSLQIYLPGSVPIMVVSMMSLIGSVIVYVVVVVIGYCKVVVVGSS